MSSYNRPFDPASNDFERMWHYVQLDYAQNGERFVWLFSRLVDWLYGLWDERKYFPSFFRQYARLWFDGFHRLQGFVISEDGNNLFFIFTRPGEEDLYAEILDWTVAQWGPRYPSLRAEVHEYQAEARAMLEERGFQSLGPVATTREYDLMAKSGEEIRLGPGYRIVDMLENDDYRGKRALQKKAFRNTDEVNEVDLLAYEYSRECPAYDPEYDLSVLAPDGKHVSACLGFTDPVHRVAEIERICTHGEFRRQGLAEAVIRECFHRLYARGIEKAYITGYSEAANGLYEKLGPSRRRQWFRYELRSLKA